jgi:predicted lipoprotein with Yx(FWY)xxD motif
MVRIVTAEWRCNVARRFLAVIAFFSLMLAAQGAVLAQDPGMGLLLTTQHPALGPILTDANGSTVYTWAGDTAGAGTSACSGGCANAWPPAAVDAETAAGLMGMAAGLGAIQRDDGSYQLTLNGWPLYLFVNDRAAGDANGNGSNGFGARWDVVSANALTGGM